VARRGGGTAGIGQRSGGDEPDMQGPCAKGRGERRRVSKRRNSTEKMYSEEYTKGTRADKAGREARQPAGKGWTITTDWASLIRPGEKSNRNLIFKFQLNLDFGKTLRFSTRRFRRNLDKGIFPKFL
jgi:hypothetical protein